MNKYEVKITERLSTVLTVQAESEEAAEEIVWRQYRNSEIILTADDYTETSVKVIPESTKPTAPLREVYVPIGTEVKEKVPKVFHEYKAFWDTHSEDTGFVLLYLDNENQITQ